MSETRIRDELFDEIGDDFLARKRRGESPGIAEYCERHPEFAEDIRKFLRTLELVDELPERDGAGPAGRDAWQAPQYIGGYRILDEIGRGGMGVVYAAEQESLKRRVALKVLPRPWLKNEQALERFQREARATAKMHHTNIVPVFEVGEEDEHLFYAMQLISGRSLQEFVIGFPASTDVDEASGCERTPASSGLTQVESGGATPSVPCPADSGGESAGSETWSSNRSDHYQWVARIGLQAAEALEYAHERNIIHRDIKPSNLLLDESGVVWVTDFGVAKIDDVDLTNTGDLVGTLRYMSPERFRGECDERSDVYALGLTLYEMLARRPAFPAANRLTLINEINSSSPARLRAIDARIPRDLETIVLKAIEKDPALRYQSAEELADDLRRFLEDRTITARRPTPLELLSRFCRRNRGLAASIATTALLLIVMTIGSIYAALHFRSQEAEQRMLTIRARDAEATMQRNLYFAQMFSTGDALSGRGGIAQVRELTDAWHPDRAGVDLRGWEWYYLRSLCDREAMSIEAHNGFVWSVDWHPDRPLAATSGSDQVVRVWDLNSGETVQEFACEGQAQSVRWSPDGTRLAIGHGNDITVRSFKMQDEILRVREAHDGVVWRVEWSPDHTQLASASNDGTIKQWDADTGKHIATIEKPESRAVLAIAWSPDGTVLATGGEREVVRLWDAKTQHLLRMFVRHPSAVRDLCFSPDGQQLAAAGHDRTISMRRVPEGDPSFSFLAASPVSAVSWSPDGQRLVSGNWDGTVRYYDVASRSEISTLFGHNARVWDVDWSPDGKSVISGSLDGVVKLWNLTAINQNLALQGPPESDRNCAVWGPRDGRLAASCKGDLLVWDSLDEEPRMFPGHEHTLRGIRWSPDGKFIATAAERESARIWDADSGTTIRILNTEGENTISVAWGPHGKQLAVANDDFVTIFAAESGRETGRIDGGHGRIRSIDWSPDGEQIAVAGLNNDIRIYSAETREFITALTGHEDGVECVRWSPDSQAIASGGFDRTVRIWDCETLRERHVLHSHSRTVKSLAWHPTTQRLASVGDDATLRIWDTEFGAEVVALTGHTDSIRAVDWSPDGVRLVTSSWDKSVRVWDAARGYQSD